MARRVKTASVARSFALLITNSERHKGVCTSNRNPWQETFTATPSDRSSRKSRSTCLQVNRARLAKRVARFDLPPGEVQAMHALARRALFTCKQVDLLLRDDLSLSVAVNVSCHGLRFDVQTPLWRSEFVISKANDLAPLAVFTRRAINQEKTTPIRFGDDGNQIGLRRRNDGVVLAEFHYGESMERIPLSTLQLYELEILAQFGLHRAFEPSGFAAGIPLPPETATPGSNSGTVHLCVA